MSKTEEFTDITLERGDRQVTWEYIGEGYSGDYNENDPDDEPLLRFCCSKLVDGEWRELDDASYCTRLSTTTWSRYLVEAAGLILEAIQNESYKRRLEELSWLCEADFREKPPATVLDASCEPPTETPDPWREPDPDYPLEDWMYEVEDHNTRSGYWEWVASQREATRV